MPDPLVGFQFTSGLRETRVNLTSSISLERETLIDDVIFQYDENSVQFDGHGIIHYEFSDHIELESYTVKCFCYFFHRN
jgi:hypothetical protein